jgi:3-deoxy-7-phosphoheptulonate synthase
MLTSNNINIESKSPLVSPGEIKSELPMALDAVVKVIAARQEICDILDRKNRKLMLIVGPCSIHDADAAVEYAQRLKKVSDEVSDAIMLIMRVYFEKPRTTVGWKGLIYDPGLNNTYNIEEGIFLARRLLLKIVDIGLPVASEMLDPILPQYIADAVSWAAIGARTSESQTHRQLASGLSMPVGFKNATDGSCQAAIDAIKTACSSHSFIGITEEGRTGVFRTRGNPYGHMVMRGGDRPNFGAEYIAFAKVAMTRSKLTPNIIVDCSHANSNKDYQKQKVALFDVLQQISEGEDAIVGAMLESSLIEGRQDIVIGQKPVPGQSVTDACIGWEETELLIRNAYRHLKTIRGS